MRYLWEEIIAHNLRRPNAIPIGVGGTGLANQNPPLAISVPFPPPSHMPLTWHSGTEVPISGQWPNFAFKKKLNLQYSTYMIGGLFYDNKLEPLLSGRGMFKYKKPVRIAIYVTLTACLHHCWENRPEMWALVTEPLHPHYLLPLMVHVNIPNP
jgi:hypothetical protein